MRCIDALPVAEKERRILWAELLREHEAAQQAVIRIAGSLSIYLPADDLKRALHELGVACAALELAEEAINNFRKEQPQ